MQLNEECCRDILKYLIENLKIQYDPDCSKIVFMGISTEMIIDNIESKDYLAEDIIYSICMLSECHFIDGINLNWQIALNAGEQVIFSVTYSGQKFYESIKSQSIWNKTKGIISQVGVHSLDFVEGVAHDVAVESAKQAVTISMMQNK